MAKALFLGIAAILAVPAAAADKPKDKSPGDVVCKTAPKPNSRFTSKTCMTREQWEALTRESQRGFAALQEKVQTPPRSE